MKKKIYIGTRTSELAVTQSKLVGAAIQKVLSETEIEYIMKMTEGDRILNKPLLEFGGKGVFVSEFEQALLKGEIDLAVHSAKDLPMELEPGLGIVAVPEREDPRDVLITSAVCEDFKSKKEIVIGTSSLRRQLQIQEIGKEMWPWASVRCENLRGNVPTRLGKLTDGLYDGIILAAAGIKRLGLEEDKRYQYHYFDCETFIPAGGQGILAVEGRVEGETAELVRGIQNQEAFICLMLERKILRLLDAGCHEPIGVYSRVKGDQIEVFGINRRNEQTRKIHLWGEIEQAAAHFFC